MATRSLLQQQPSARVKPFSLIPGPRGLPYLGTLLDYKTGKYAPSSFDKAFRANHQKYGKIFKETIAGSTKVHLCDPDYAQRLFQLEGKRPHTPPLLETSKMYRKINRLSLGLGNMNGEKWSRSRKAVGHLLMKPKSVSQFLPHINGCVDDFITKIHHLRDEEGLVENFSNEIKMWTLESTANICFETRLGALNGTAAQSDFIQRMVNAMDSMLEQALKLRFSFGWWRLLPTPAWQKLYDCEDFFFSNAQRIVNEAISKMDALLESGDFVEGHSYPFLSYLLGREELSLEDVRIISMAMFSDGMITTSPTVASQLYCLATNPEVQDKVYEEVLRVVGIKTKEITSGHLEELSYLKSCIKEGFRFFPIGTEISRIVPTDITIGGYLIPKGTHVEVNTNMLLQSPQYFHDAHRFIPERWTRDGSASNVHPYLVRPFSCGPRMCPGKRIAEQEMLTFIAKLLRHYRVEWRESHEMSQRYRILLAPDCSADFYFIPRNN
ncbi:hypothetical protein CAPTEDRAFT_171547 [Capitella teleta]|uniref:Uncharacterized protein n=1 Tax=Capitella teleta TaxID=283909 RepID=R7TCD0_CAPTE|nr:hypothetical protein CAPTEDRAFT_171547 [Capitella teleta]|eukprot:ELT89157.1 hypothetical protein CAPTEDRAFT_171547 [Capitella teleta]